MLKKQIIHYFILITLQTYIIIFEFNTFFAIIFIDVVFFADFVAIFLCGLCYFISPILYFLLVFDEPKGLWCIYFTA